MNITDIIERLKSAVSQEITKVTDIISDTLYYVLTQCKYDDLDEVIDSVGVYELEKTLVWLYHTSFEIQNITDNSVEVMDWYINVAIETLEEMYK